ncbi:MAG: hypothetical protein ACRCS6_04575 [Turicibacter sp.]
MKLKEGNAEVSKVVKAKVMGMRIELSKLRKAFEADLQEVVNELKPEGYDELVAKEDKTEDDLKQIETWNEKVNDEYNAFVTEKISEEVSFTKKFTEEEYYELVEVNAGNDVEINGTPMQATDFLEVIYSLFVD